jgi:hypothetical protein
MIAMTTSNSIRVKPVVLFAFVCTKSMFASPKKKLLSIVTPLTLTDTRGREVGASTTELEGGQGV